MKSIEKINMPCKSCGKVRMIDRYKFSFEKYVKRSPNCRKCATKNPKLRNKISRGWFKKGIQNNINGGFPKEHKPWNKGIKGYMGANRTSFTKESTKEEKNINWKGGITPENVKIRHSPEYKDWRTKVFKRDDYTCQNCESRGYRLHADHIKPFAYFPELRLAIDNGRTLCVTCHQKTPTYSLGARKIYGKKA
jgi:hypothetical protein